MTKQINEDFIQIKQPEFSSQPPVKHVSVVKENLEAIYGDNSNGDNSTVTTTKIHNEMIEEITIDGQTIQIANQNFVNLTRNFMSSMMQDFETLKRDLRNKEREIAQLKSKIESMHGAIKSNVKSLERQISNRSSGFGEY